MHFLKNFNTNQFWSRMILNSSMFSRAPQDVIASALYKDLFQKPAPIPIDLGVMRYEHHQKIA